MCVISVIQNFWGKFQMNENAFKEVLKKIQYAKGEAPVFEILAYNIKAGGSWVKNR